MKKRSQIEERYKWDKSCLCLSSQDFEEKIEKINVFLPKFKKFTGKLDNKDAIWKYLKLDEQFEKELDPAILYIYLSRDENLADGKNNKLFQKMSILLNKFSIETSPLSTQIQKLSDELLNEIIADKKFKDYRRDFEMIKKSKKHNLTDDQEKLLSGMDFLGYSSVMRNLSDVDLKFDKIKDSSGKSYPFEQSKYSLYVRDNDRALRKNAMAVLNGTFGKFINTFAENYINKVKADCYFSKVRHYDSALSKALFHEEVSEKVYHTLIEKVHENLPVLFKYFDLKKKALGLKDFYIYDCLADISSKKREKYSYDEAIELLKKALAPLGEEYVALLQKAKDERWIDVFPNENKRSGAYENGIYDAHPFVLSNFEGDLESVFTLAHELGHAMHTYFSNKFQPRPTASYTIFLAEIASTTNEMLLLSYLLDRAKGREKIKLYNKLFDMVKSTIFRQTMFAEFEEKIHNLQEASQPLTKELLCEEYFKLNKLYFGKVRLIKEIQYEWARIPHFFTEFYVYKYATGLVCAINFANRILSGEKGALEDYFKFLSAGSSDNPCNILKKSGCDLESGKAYEVAFDFLKGILKDWQKEMN